MNILPKKRWHVRTKDNIAKVRRDEAAAAEEEKKKQLRVQIAEREARTEALRKKARQQFGSYSRVTPQTTFESQENFPANKHVNLFYELEHEDIVSNKPNEEHEKEKKLEKEKYEKQIGYLVYLGQDTNELTGNVSWYNKLPKETDEKNEKNEVGQKQKIFEDPLIGIRKYLGCEGLKKIKKELKVVVNDNSKEKKSYHSETSKSHIKQKKKSKKHKLKKEKKKKKKKKRKKNKSSESDDSSDSERFIQKSSISLEKMRNDRLRREHEERQRAAELFAKLNGVNIKKEEPVFSECAQKYNSQFNPHLAKQNFK